MLKLFGYVIVDMFPIHELRNRRGDSLDSGKVSGVRRPRTNKLKMCCLGQSRGRLEVCRTKAVDESK